MGLPGSGKTTLANELGPLLDAKRLNADEVRKEANDWDFSEEGRKRQAKRMSDFALKLKEQGFNVVADFICPTPEARRLFPADYVIWVDTIKEGRVRQAKRMAEAALKLKAEGHYVIADFIAPTPEARKLFPADYIIWVDTIKKGRFEDTNQMFVNPEKFDFKVTTQDAKNWAPKIAEEIKK